MDPSPRQLPAAQTPLHAVARIDCPATLPYVPAGHCVHVVAPDANEKEPAGHAAQDEPLRKNPALHVAVPTKVRPPAAIDQEADAAAALVSPAAKQRFCAPKLVPSNFPPAYVKLSTLEVVASGSDSVAAVQLKQFARAAVTGPAGHTPK